MSNSSPATVTSLGTMLWAKTASVLRQSPGGVEMSNFLPATLTSLGAASFLGKNAVGPQAVATKEQRHRKWANRH